KVIGEWVLGKTIGEGSSGKVKLAVKKGTNEMPLASSSTPSEVTRHHKKELYMIREAALGMLLNHPNIVRLHSAVLGDNHFYCLFEHVPGEDLVDHISRVGKIREKRARVIFRGVLRAIEYAHRNHVVHRDIKLENIRYDETTDSVKVLDFGFASFYRPSSYLYTNCGSPCYAAPEIYDNRPYRGPEVDVWSLGVSLASLLGGRGP
ncbi:kinase-like domain-containing protein, partial [Blyttiomyces helicus]